ncbi:hypothetical protein [Pseudogemmobacter sonorensis]|uniref:hypothetical protein n=1 Tax=Pseudogemmobacter sonorensis TaxID=2989681 RepID=UPI0036D1A13A
MPPLSALAVFAALLVASPVGAEELAPNLSRSVEATRPGPARALSTALRLYAEGEAQKDALSMAVAARLAARIEIRAASGWARRDGPASTRPAEIRTPAVSPDTLLSGAAMTGARLMAEEDALLADLLADLPPPGARDRIGALSMAEDRLGPGSGAIWDIPFPGQSPAEIAVFPTGPGAILWRVEDAGGHPVCPETAAAALAACAFTPDRNGFFRVIVTNGAQTANDGEAGYLLLAN